jgi:hypothetical protein
MPERLEAGLGVAMANTELCASSVPYWTPAAQVMRGMREACRVRIADRRRTPRRNWSAMRTLQESDRPGTSGEHMHNDLVHPNPVSYLRKHERPVAAHAVGIAIHDGKICPHGFG